MKHYGRQSDVNENVELGGDGQHVLQKKPSDISLEILLTLLSQEIYFGNSWGNAQLVDNLLYLFHHLVSMFIVSISLPGLIFFSNGCESQKKM